MQLEPEQEHLVVEMVRAARKVERHEQTLTLLDDDAGDILDGPGGPRRVLGRDVQALSRAGLLDNVRANYLSGYEYVVSSEGYAYVDALRVRVVAPAGDEPTGWKAVDAALDKLRTRLAQAKDSHDFKAVGHQAVTVLEVLGRATLDPERHLPDGEPLPAPERCQAPHRLRY